MGWVFGVPIPSCRVSASSKLLLRPTPPTRDPPANDALPGKKVPRHIFKKYTLRSTRKLSTSVLNLKSSRKKKRLVKLAARCMRDESMTHEYITHAHTRKGAADTRPMGMDVDHSWSRAYGCSMAARPAILRHPVLLHDCHECIWRGAECGQNPQLNLWYCANPAMCYWGELQGALEGHGSVGRVAESRCVCT